MSEFQINYLAVGVAALATIFIGALWYSPLLFHKFWVKAHGYSEEKVEQMRKAAGRAFIVSLLCYVVMAFVLAVFVPTRVRRRYCKGPCSASLYGSDFSPPWG